MPQPRASSAPSPAPIDPGTIEPAPARKAATATRFGLPPASSPGASRGPSPVPFAKARPAAVAFEDDDAGVVGHADEPDSFEAAQEPSKGGTVVAPNPLLGEAERAGAPTAPAPAVPSSPLMAVTASVHRDPTAAATAAPAAHVPRPVLVPTVKAAPGPAAPAPMPLPTHSVPGIGLSAGPSAPIRTSRKKGLGPTQVAIAAAAVVAAVLVGAVWLAAGQADHVASESDELAVVPASAVAAVELDRTSSTAAERGRAATTQVEPPVVEDDEALAPEDEAMAEESNDLLDELDAEQAATRSRPRVRRRRPKAEIEPEPQPEPEPDPDPEPTFTPPPPRPGPGELLADAERALAAGNADQAYRLAKRSHDAAQSDAALSVMTRSACRSDERDDAISALRQLPLLERTKLRRDCRRAGHRIGL